MGDDARASDEGTKSPIFSHGPQPALPAILRRDHSRSVGKAVREDRNADRNAALGGSALTKLVSTLPPPCVILPASLPHSQRSHSGAAGIAATARRPAV